jgi:hypothetical protein
MRPNLFIYDLSKGESPPDEFGLDPQYNGTGEQCTLMSPVLDQNVPLNCVSLPLKLEHKVMKCVYKFLVILHMIPEMTHGDLPMKF